MESVKFCCVVRTHTHFGQSIECSLKASLLFASLFGFMSTAFDRYLIAVALSPPSITRLNLFFTTKTQVACINLLIFVAVQLLDRDMFMIALFVGSLFRSLVKALMEAFLQAFGESSFEGLHLGVGQETGSLIVAIEASRD